MGKKTDPNTFLCVLVFPGRTFKHVIGEQQLPQGRGKTSAAGRAGSRDKPPAKPLPEQHHQDRAASTCMARAMSTPFWGRHRLPLQHLCAAFWQGHSLLRALLCCFLLGKELLLLE